MAFDQCYERAIRTEVGGLETLVISLPDAITLKEIALGSGNDKAAHARDQADLDELTVLLAQK